MLVIRAIEEKDLDELMSLLEDSGHGLTTLPKDRKIIKNKILYSQRSFAHREELKPKGESYLFVMEDITTKKIVGISGVISKIGGFEPYYFYRVKEEKRFSKAIDKTSIIKTLHLERVHNGPAEVCSLYLHPDYRSGNNGRLLSLSRFLFIADNRDYFEDTVIAEMRGKVNDDGTSPFWEAVGSKFTGIDFTEADYLLVKDKSFVEDLIPNYPIIADLLPKEAQEIIGEVHPNTAPAKHILEKEGFSFNGLVGPIEPGPIIEASINNVRTIQNSRILHVSEIIDELDDQSDIQVISNNVVGPGFRATFGQISIQEDQVIISKRISKILQIKIGDALRTVSLRKKS